MADILVRLRDDNGVVVRYSDNGDGTWSLAQSAAAQAAALASTYLGAGTDRSGSITTANNAQQLAPANTTRKRLDIQNTSAGDLWINEIGGAAVLASPSYKIVAGASLNVRTSRAISIIGATAGQTWSSTET